MKKIYIVVLMPLIINFFEIVHQNYSNFVINVSLYFLLFVLFWLMLKTIKFTHNAQTMIPLILAVQYPVALLQLFSKPLMNVLEALLMAFLATILSNQKE